MPANVPPLNEVVDPNKPLSMRQRMESHRSNPVCANCHRLMDPIGFAMENFDGIGKLRADDGGAVIDTKGTIADGTKVDGVAAVRGRHLSRPELFVRTVTEALMTYALPGASWGHTICHLPFARLSRDSAKEQPLYI